MELVSKERVKMNKKNLIKGYVFFIIVILGVIYTLQIPSPDPSFLSVPSSM